MNVEIPAKGHANLDSFPFRYGFYFNNDSTIELTNVKNRRVLDKGRYSVDAYFKNPENNKSERGHFIILASKRNRIVTVWRLGGEYGTEMKLSETLRTARERGDIDSNDMIKMHTKKVRTHIDLIAYLSSKLSNNEIEKIEKKTEKQVEALSKALAKVSAERDELKQQNIKHPEGITNSLMVDLKYFQLKLFLE